MTQRMIKNIDVLKALCHCNKEEQKDFIKAAKPEVIHAVCDCITNVLHGNIPISRYSKRKLKPKRQLLRALSQPKKNAEQRKKLLVQQGAGLLPLLIGPALKILLPNLLP